MATGHLVRSNNTSDRGMDRKPVHGSLRMGAASRYLIRDHDGAYGEVFIRRLRSMGIRDQPTPPRSPWQNGYAERLIGSMRRECLDHVVVFGECATSVTYRRRT
jgi:transposase InsO family protein